MRSSEPLFTIGRAAEKTGLTKRALRLYEREGLLTPERHANGYRKYGASDIKHAGIIGDLRRAEVPLKEIARIISIKRMETPPREKLRECLDALNAMRKGLMEKRRGVDASLKRLDSMIRQCGAAMERK
jgi:DNA-binding transcriptional MerR regulator